jgi:hypothetical protein
VPIDLPEQLSDLLDQLTGRHVTGSEFERRILDCHGGLTDYVGTSQVRKMSSLKGRGSGGGAPLASGRSGVPGTMRPLVVGQAPTCAFELAKAGATKRRSIDR